MSSSDISGRIHRLPPLLIDKIAAGEVIDGPYSVVKELMENSLDAGAGKIRVAIESGGLALVLIEDDGGGIRNEDLPMSVERHATSKITDLEDIEHISSFGFRGEALASIASVSHLEIRSRNREEKSGGLLESRGGSLVRQEPVAMNGGTIISVRDLFYATPVRKKFVKSERTENSRIHREIIKASLAHPGVRFEYIRDGKEFLVLPERDSLLKRISDIYKMDMTDRLLSVEGEYEGIRLEGYLSFPGFHRGNREGQFQFVNGRPVEIKNLPVLVKKAYGELLPPGAFPYFFLFVQVEPTRVDVNVHPAKREVRLLDESLLNSLVIRSVGEALKGGEPIPFKKVAAGRFGTSSATSGSPSGSSSDGIKTSTELLFEGNEIQPGRVYTIGDSEGDRSFSSMSSGNGEGGLSFGELMGRDDEESKVGGLAEVREGGVSEEREESSGGNSSFRLLRHFGVIFGTYILAEGRDGLYIIDQHTAHERINYERMRGRLHSMRGQRQSLLHPILIRCLPDELETILEQRPRLEENGFVVEEYGPEACLVREVPVYVDPGTEEDTVSHLIQRIVEGEESYRIYDEFAALKACKASIKRNDYVSGEVISEVLEDLARCEEPSRCPHGRPTMIRITREDLDRMFLRSGG